MKIPRDASGEELAQRLSKFGYKPSRQTGSHMRLTRTSEKGEHHITVPIHKSIRIGILNSILMDVAVHLEKKKDDLVNELFQ